jgi:hypothetical protein
MPREYRRISFDFTEIYKAIFALCVQKELPQPFAGSITAIGFRDGEDKDVIIRFVDGLQGTTGTSEYSRDFLAAALMLYCRTCNIPIPKKAIKSVEPGDERVTLHITS